MIKKFLPRIANLLLWLSFCGLTGTGLLLAWRLPPGSQGGRGLSAMGLGRHDWGEIHTWVSYGFGLLILLHMVFHWRWFWQMAARRRRWPLLVGLFAGLIILLVLVFQPVHHEVGHGKGREHHEGSH
ncbi:MAG: hypothetical protein Fur0032_02790 [Terrimicrobiaceae bacterium]